MKSDALKRMMKGIMVLVMVLNSYSLIGDDKKLYDFESGTQGWWSFKSEDVSIKLENDTQDSSGGKASLKLIYKYGKPGSYLGVGVEPKWIMGGKSEMSAYQAGHLKISLKSVPSARIKIEFRGNDKKTYSHTLPPIGEIWGNYSIPLSEFKSKDQSLDPNGFLLSQIVIIPTKAGDSEATLWIDEISLSSEKIEISGKPYEFKIKGKTLSDSEALSNVSLSLCKKDGFSKLMGSESMDDGNFELLYTLPRETFIVDPKNACSIETEISGVLVAEKEAFAASLREVKLNLGENIINMELSKGKVCRELFVDTYKIKTADGEDIWLQGLCVDSLQWSSTGDRILQSLIVAIDKWSANVIRLPVKDDFWFGKGKWQNDGGVYYRSIIDAAIRLCSGRGVYIVIDLHRFGAPMPEHAEFWKEFAGKYKNTPAVLFEIFNEAHGISWEIWRDGGDLRGAKEKSGDVNVEENKERNSSNYSIGMQALIDVIRNTGAKNIIVAGGLDWSYDLTGVVNGFSLDNKNGNGIVYSTHVYPWKRNWDKFLCAAEKHPIFIGEVGNLRRWEDFSFIKPDARHEPVGPESAWPGDMLGLIQKYKFHWTGFSFHPKCGPMIIQDWEYTPTDYWGVFVKDALAGKKFEMNKLR